jgi:hypothetical protein
MWSMALGFLDFNDRLSSVESNIFFVKYMTNYGRVLVYNIMHYKGSIISMLVFQVSGFYLIYDLIANGFETSSKRIPIYENQ